MLKLFCTLQESPFYWMRFILLLFFGLHVSFAQAQVDLGKKYVIQPKIHYGFIWDFADEVSHLANQHLRAYEVTFAKKSTGEKEWQRAYRYPNVSYSFFYYAFDPSKPIGNISAALIHAGKKLIQSKRVTLSWKIGAGLALTDKRFEVETNFKNNVVSQRINFGLNGQVMLDVALSPRLSWQMGLGLMHFSNGSQKLPNFGVNLPSAQMGIGYSIVNAKTRLARDSSSFVKPKTYLHISGFLSYKEVYPTNGPKYALGGTTVFVERRLNRKSGLQLGLDFSYDHSKKAVISNDTIAVRNNFFNRGQTAFVIGHELYMDRISLMTHVGVYLLDPTKINTALYQKVGLKYYITNQVFSSVVMKIHLGVADWVEWGIGVRL